jgi:Nitrous oxide-stimulated promoter
VIPDNARVKRERRTVRHMVGIYCRAMHHQPGLCEDCSDLVSYAMGRLDRCVLKADKPTCKACPVHCYRADKREQMRQVMIFSGPRMLLSHPILAIRHLLDERKPPPKYLRPGLRA